MKTKQEKPCTGKNSINCSLKERRRTSFQTIIISLALTAVVLGLSSSAVLPSSFGVHHDEEVDPYHVFPMDVGVFNEDGFIAIHYPMAVDTFLIDDMAYSIITGASQNAIQIVNVTDPHDISAIDYAVHKQHGWTALIEPRDVETFVIGDSTYAIVVGGNFTDGTVQIIDVSDPSDIKPADAAFDDQDGFTTLRIGGGVTTFVIGDKTYAIVAAWHDKGVQIIDISDPYNIKPTDYAVNGQDGFKRMYSPANVETFVIGDKTYAIVVSSVGIVGGVQIIDVSDPSDIKPMDIAYDGNDGFEALDGAHDVRTYTVGGKTYAIVVSIHDYAVQIIDVSDPSDIKPADAAFDGYDGFECLMAAFSVDIFTLTDKTYAVVTARNVADCVQIMDITDPYNLIPTDVAINNQEGFTMLGLPNDVAIYTINEPHDDHIDEDVYAVVLNQWPSGSIQMMALNVLHHYPASSGGDDDNDSGSNDYDFLNAPTFGLAHDSRSTRMIDSGISLNGFTMDVDSFHTEFARQILQTGQNNTLSAKVMAPYGLKTIEFFYGVPHIGAVHEAEGSIEVHLNPYDKSMFPEITDVHMRDGESLLHADKLNYEIKRVDCIAGDAKQGCYQIDIHFAFANVPIGEVFALQAVDAMGWSTTEYFNDGFAVEGKPLTGVTEMISSDLVRGGGGLIEIIQVDRKNDLWLSTADNSTLYTKNEFGFWKKLSPESYPSKCQDTEYDESPWNTMTRMHCQYDKLVDYENKKAQKVFDSSAIQKELPGSFAHEFPLIDGRTMIMYEMGYLTVDDVIENLKYSSEYDIEKVRQMLSRHHSSSSLK